MKLTRRNFSKFAGTGVLRSYGGAGIVRRLPWRRTSRCGWNYCNRGPGAAAPRASAEFARCNGRPSG